MPQDGSHQADMKAQPSAFHIHRRFFIHHIVHYFVLLFSISFYYKIRIKENKQ